MKFYYFTSGGTAMTSGDYTAASGSLTFAPGEASKTISIAVSDDSLNEANENFYLILSGVTNANVGDGTGQATILDNDSSPSASVNDISVTEGNSGTTLATFTVRLSTPAGKP